MRLVEEGVTQAPETLRTFGWSFHKKIEGSSRWAERLGDTISTKLGRGGASLGQTLKDFRDRLCRLLWEGDVACPWP